MSDNVHTTNDLAKRRHFLLLKLADIRKRIDSYGKNQSKDIADSDGDSDDSDTTMFTVKLLNDFDGKKDQLHPSYLRQACRLKRQIELTQIREDSREVGNLHSPQLDPRKFKSQDSICAR